MIQELPKTIYHYCDLNAFISILKNRTIWLSNSATTNDSRENNWINHHIENYARFNQPKNEYLDLYNRIIKSYYTNPELPYISCFSEDGDLLSQWRAYANDGKGVSIGFNLDTFNHVGIFDNSPTNGDSVIISKVVYNEEEQFKIVSELFSYAFELLDKGEEEHAHQVGHSTLKRISMICKNSAFSEEKEIRIIYNPYYMNLISNIERLKSNDKLKNLPVEFRVKEDKLITYFKYSFDKTISTKVFESIILGPKNMTTQYDIKVLMNTFEINGIQVIKSKASYV